MTAKPDLLPLRDWMECLGEINAEDIRDYARANVAHATAAKDAEVDALRAEVERLKALVRSVGYETLDRAEQAEARAERLAEALRAERRWWVDRKADAIREQVGGLTRGDPGAIARCDAAIQRINAALRDQEGKESFWPKLPGSGGPDWTGHD